MVVIEGWNHEPKCVHELTFLPHLWFLRGLQVGKQNYGPVRSELNMRHCKINYFKVP